MVQNQKHTAVDRSIRVFVSSTFRDMQAERDELVLRIFPQLRQLCEQRDVMWCEIDLRWGITEEQSERGEVILICLEEIHRCRPYFIGLLGERYGWIPDAIPPDVLEQEPWISQYISEHAKKSVTELEILHGVLNNPDTADHAYFYFRDPTYVDQIPAAERNDYLEQDPVNRQRLAALKDRLRTSNLALKENCPDPATLGQWVLADFTAMIDSIYPEGRQPSPLERERLDHDGFARSRASVYIGRPEYFDRLDAHVASNGPPLVVLGESGSGKSALLANWALRYQEQHPNDFLLLHFVGASPSTANALAILRRIMLELKQRFVLPEDLPTQPDKIREALPDWLANAAAQAAWPSRPTPHPIQGRPATGKIVLVLDALNQVEDIDNAPDLGWLPRVFPQNCRVIVSTLPGRSLQAIEQRSWLDTTPPLEIQPLDNGERQWLIQDFLKQYSRDLGPARTDRLIRAPQTTNPLYLRILLNELRVFGLHEKLNERIEWYLEAEDPFALYRKVISRWEEAYAAGTPLVRDALSLLWAARRGLSESELLQLLGADGKPLPHSIWSPLYLAMSGALVSRSSLLTFAHDFLRTTTHTTYLVSDSAEQVAHRRLADYFQRQPTWTDRKLDEYPWQLQRAASWDQLKTVLSDIHVFLLFRSQERWKQDLQSYWLAMSTKLDACAAYEQVATSWLESDIGQDEIGREFNDLGLFHFERLELDAANRAYQQSVEIANKEFGESHPYTLDILNNQALLLQEQAHYGKAEKLARFLLTKTKDLFGRFHESVAVRLTNLAGLLSTTNQFAEAEAFYREALDVCRAVHSPEHPNVARELNNLGVLYLKTDRFGEAERLFNQALEIEEAHFWQAPSKSGDCVE